ncbi:hypothetical protein [Streptomyces sp. CBMA156]|uniref:hypothetical protein n=1 Tax=Streptomyces sp. CBMA156 TaxID=1930280 RepID=UPI0016620B6B|nr:hypothetical protein [Streptomyces sp. CBMA156]
MTTRTSESPCRQTGTGGYRLLDTPTDASDHHGLAVRLDLSLAATDDVWEYR